MELCEVVDRLAEVVDGLEPALFSGEDASKMVGVFERAGRLCSAGKTLMVRRAAECNEWARAGARSPQEWLSGVSGSSPGEAQRTLETAKRTAEQPELEESLRSGEISPDQASEIARVTKDHPEAVRDLIEMAKKRGFKGFKRACRQVALSSRSREEDEKNAARQRDSQHCKMWVGQDGMGRIDAQLAPLEFATFKSFFDPFERQAFETASRAGLRQPSDRYRADALLAMAQTAANGRAGVTPDAGDGGTAPHAADAPTDTAGAAGRKLPAMVIAVIDYAVFQRGHALPGERHYIEGIGPVPVTVLEELMKDAMIAVVVAKGTDVASVVHLGRHPTALQRTALHVRDPHCVIPGCEQDQHLEIDHVPDFNQTRHTTLPELARECAHHHDQRTYQGAVLTGGPGNWHWQPPPPGPDQAGPPPGWTGGPFDDQPPTANGP